MDLKCGVPQGSFLSPLCYPVYTADLASLFDSLGIGYHMYADDVQYHITVDIKSQVISDTVETAEKVFELVAKSMYESYLKLNSSKKAAIFLGNLKNSVTIWYLNLRGSKIELSTKVKNLGVLFDSSLSLKPQILNVVKNANYHLRELKFIKSYICTDSLKKLVFSLVITRLDYANALYISLPNSLLNKLQVIMNRGVRLICNLERRDRVTPSLISLHLLRIKARIQLTV